MCGYKGRTEVRDVSSILYYNDGCLLFLLLVLLLLNNLGSRFMTRVRNVHNILRVFIEVKSCRFCVIEQIPLCRCS